MSYEGTKRDASDWEGTGPEFEQALKNATGDPLPEEEEQSDEPKDQKRFIVEMLGDFLAKEIKPREFLLEPWLPVQGLTMIHAARGIGKTHVALGVCHAVASGGSFLGWKAPKPNGVLMIDGEMPAVVMQERLAQIVKHSEKEPTAPFKIITPDSQEMGMPSLSDAIDQVLLEQYLDDIKLIVVDNISTLVRSGKENEEQSWAPVQAWALQQRSQGRSVLWVHHSGKNGLQRGTSKREDVLDSIIRLKRPIDYDASQGAVFEVHFEKARGFYGEEAEPFEATLTSDSESYAWEIRSLEKKTLDLVVELLKEGISQADIARELELNKSTVSRHAKKARELGLVK